MTIAEDSYAYVTPVGRVRYDDEAFEPPIPEVVEEPSADGLSPDFVEAFHAVVEQLTDNLMASGSLDRASCRADAIKLLTLASARLQKDDPAVESPLAYFLMEERQKAEALLDPSIQPRQPLTFMKA